MKSREIARIIAGHILSAGNLNEYLDTSDRSEAMMDALDTLVREQRRRTFEDLAPLKEASPSEIYDAFQIFGPFETCLYLQQLAGSENLYDHKSLYMAALKLDDPEKSWDDIAQLADQASSIDIKNPQMILGRRYGQKMEEGIFAFQKNGSIDDLPFIQDRFYLNTIMNITDTIHYDPAKAIPLSIQLIEYALDHATDTMVVDQELRLAGLLALASQTLPGAGWKSGAEDYDLAQNLQAALDKCVSYGYEPEVAQLSRLMARVETRAAAGSQLFKNPVQLALDLYTHDLAEKVREVLTEEHNALPPGQGPHKTLQLG